MCFSACFFSFFCGFYGSFWTDLINEWMNENLGHSKNYWTELNWTPDVSSLLNLSHTHTQSATHCCAVCTQSHDNHSTLHIAHHMMSTDRWAVSQGWQLSSRLRWRTSTVWIAHSSARRSTVHNRTSWRCEMLSPPPYDRTYSTYTQPLRCLSAKHSFYAICLLEFLRSATYAGRL